MKEYFNKAWNLVKQRRVWVAAIPVAVIVANHFGVEVTAEMLESTMDKVLAGGMSSLALWSYFKPKG